MSSQEGFSINKSPLFNKTNYAFWSIRLHTYRMDLGFDIQELVVTSYTMSITPPINVVENKPCENNANTMNEILSNILKSEFVKVVHC